MFDSVLDRGNVPKQQLGSGTILSIVAHALILGGVIYLSSRPHAPVKQEVDVKFMAAAPPPPPPPPPPPGGGPSTPKKTEPKPHPIKKPDTIVESKDKEKPKEEPKEEPKEKPQEGGQPGGVEGGVQGGVVGGTVGGVVGGVIGGTLGGTGTAAVPPPPKSYSFDRSLGMTMARPNSQPQMSREALTAKVEGLVLLKCTITKGGRATHCVIVKGLPFMDDVVLKWAASSSFTPVTLQGQPIDCDNVTFPLRFKLQ